MTLENEKRAEEGNGKEPENSIERIIEFSPFFEKVDVEDLGSSVRAVLSQSTNREIYLLEIDTKYSDVVVAVSNLPISEKEGEDLFREAEDLDIDFPDGDPTTGELAIRPR